MRKHFWLVLAGLAVSVAVSAAPQTFDFKDPKGVNNAVFKLDAPLESINGTATGISGTISFDPAAPEKFTGKIVVAANSLHVGNSTMKEHLHGKDWLDVTKHPEIVFEVTSVKNANTTGDTTTADVTGQMSLKGVTKTLTVPVKLTYLKDKLKTRFPKLEGDLLVARVNFKIKRSDFGINSGAFEDKVSNEIDLSLSIAGQSPK